MRRSLLPLLTLLLLFCAQASAQTPPSIHVEGNELQDTHGNPVVLHGVMDTPNPYFNSYRWGTTCSSSTRTACINYFEQLFTAITDTAQGAHCTMFRLHLDPCWSNDESITQTGDETGEANISQFSERYFRTYLNTLYWPIIYKALQHGLYVVVRPPGVCPAGIRVDGYYQEYLKTVWDIVSSNTYFKKYAGQVSLELANEPVNIYDADSLESESAAHDFFQPIVDVIRANGFTGIIWVPGAGYQSLFQDFETYPIEGYNIGYAAHDYVGWYNCSDETADGDALIEQFHTQVPVVDTNPVIITEVDWSPEAEGEGHYDEDGDWVEANLGTWATGTTSSWGVAFKQMVDYYGIGFTLSGTDCYIDVEQYLEDGTVTPAFDGNEEACSGACWEWYADYALVDYPFEDFSYQSKTLYSNGTRFRNPVIASDFPDPDVAYLDGVYYMISTTMHLFPGGTILKSYDLVNWEYCFNAFDQLSSADKYCLVDGQESYAEGMWAAALTEHDGMLYLLINGNDAGGFILYTDDPEGDWTMQQLDRVYYDPGLLFDDDGYVYIPCGVGDISVCKLDQNFNYITSTTVITDRSGLEGSHMYKIGDYYYIYATYGGWPSGQAIFRSTSPMGTYTEQMLIEKYINDEANTVHQGALIETQTGEWWTMLMEDLGAFGRCPSLHPVTWEDGWPIIGEDGVPQQTYAVPDVGTTYAETVLPTNDNFRTYPLGLQWQWNHNADDGKWTLFENPGYLRLYTATVTDDPMLARNTLTQRIFLLHDDSSPYALDGDTPATGTIRLLTEGMQEGDMAGLMVQQDPYACLAVRKDASGYSLVWRKDTLDWVDDFEPATTELASVAIDSVIYLRAQYDYDESASTFYYSLDNSTWTQVGDATTHSYNLSVFVGVRFGIFNYATEALGGYVDVDWFSTEDTFEESMFYTSDWEGYSEEMLTMESLVLEDGDDVEVQVGTGYNLTLTATFADGHTENVASSAKYTLDEDIAVISAGVIKGQQDGTTAVKATYTDPMGNSQTVYFDVTSAYFPFSSDYVSVIYGSGTYRESAQAFFPGQYGQIGWTYENGVDMSGYDYMVFQLKRQQSVGAWIYIFTENSIWGNCHAHEVGEDTEVVIPLNDIVYTSGDDTGEAVETSHVYYVTVWAGSEGSIVLSDAYLTNNDDYTRTGIEDVSATSTQPAGDGALYNLMGMKVSQPISGHIYILDGKKILWK